MQRSGHLVKAVTGASGLPAAPAIRTESPVAIPSGGLWMTRSSGIGPSRSRPRCRGRARSSPVSARRGCRRRPSRRASRSDRRSARWTGTLSQRPDPGSSTLHIGEAARHQFAGGIVDDSCICVVPEATSTDLRRGFHGRRKLPAGIFRHRDLALAPIRINGT